MSVFLRLVFALCMLIAYAEGSSLGLYLFVVYSPSIVDLIIFII